MSGQTQDQKWFCAGIDVFPPLDFKLDVMMLSRIFGVGRRDIEGWYRYLHKIMLFS